MTKLTIAEISSLIAFLVGLIGGVEYLLVRIKKWLKKVLEEEFNLNKRVSMDLLRLQMLQIYYEYKDTKKIPMSMKQGLDISYDTYIAMGGNSFIVNLKKEMDTWEVIV